ncbi:hypothetical protein C8Q77DRAFT_341865 [Trametes polyzona]|nr:hypothetical protein C8Q77DRAFT_341865 [Trametes polyzona]
MTGHLRSEHVPFTLPTCTSPYMLGGSDDMVALAESFNMAILVISMLFMPVNAATERIDNTDPRVFYSGTWTHLPAFADPSQNNYNGTLALTTASGAFATIMFNATKVSVYGMLANTTTVQMKSRYSLDQRLPEYYEPPQDIGALPEYQVLFWQSANLALYEHTLRVENNGDQFWLDYLEVEVPDRIASAPTTTPSSATPSTSSSAAPLSSTTSEIPPYPIPSSSDTSSSASISSSLSGSLPVSTTSAVRSSSLVPSTSAPSSFLSSTTGPPTSSSSPFSEMSSSSATDAPLPTQRDGAQSPHARSRDLSGGAVAGLAVGVSLFGQAVLLVAIWCWCRRRKRSQAPSVAQAIARDRVGRSLAGSPAQQPVLSPDYTYHDGIADANTPSAESDWVTEQDNRTRDLIDHILTSRRGSRVRSRAGRLGGSRHSPAIPNTSSTSLLNTASSHHLSEADRPGRAAYAHWTDTDGGIRLAGGPLGVENTGMAADATIIYPPPYRSSYGSGSGEGEARDTESTFPPVTPAEAGPER